MVSSKSVSTILSQLRTFMLNKVCVSEVLNAYIIPSGDAHQSEYIAPRHKRREYVSKFTGSAGTAIVTPTQALLWTDGRYFIQAEAELDPNCWTLMKSGLPDTLTQEEWLSKNLQPGSYVGVDPNLLSLEEWRRISEALKKTGQHLIRVDPNLVDLVWQDDDIPDEPTSDLLAWKDNLSGKRWEVKVAEVREKMAEEDVFAVVVAALDEVAWLFNLRGGDIQYNPVFMAYAIVTTDDVSLFIDESRLESTAIRQHLNLDDNSEGKMKPKIFPYGGVHEELRSLGKLNKKIWISSKDSCALASFVPDTLLKSDVSPICVMKAVKNDVEIEGMKNAHIRDAVALCEYLWWLEKQVHSTNSVDEVTAANKLDDLRRQQQHFVSLSFSTISAAGPNGAIIHYRPHEESARVIEKEDMYVVDSGGQYLDGTTDVTRTVHFGTPTTHQRECFTRVLKGHIALARVTFPDGTRGHILDLLARTHLWEIGLDYPHGTGHGVGAFLNVHEGPIGISPRRSEDKPLHAGMFLSDEPGYYEDGNFGIRIESIILTKDVSLRHNFNDKGFLGFEPVTLVPIQQKLLAAELLTKEEVDWLNNYHSNVLDVVGGMLREQGKLEVLDWLVKETQPLG